MKKKEIDSIDNLIDKLDIDSFLSIDNGKGILLNRDDVELLGKMGLDFYSYNRISELLIDLNDILDDGEGDDEIDELIGKLEEMYYYNEVNK